MVLGRNLGRPEERVKVVPLSAFDPTEIDMLTIVLFGSSTSKAFVRGDGKTVAFTPRGYAVKAEAKERAMLPTWTRFTPSCFRLRS